MNEELLARLADTLEGINGSLAEIAESMENLEQSLDRCLVSTPNGHFLRITGAIQNY